MNSGAMSCEKERSSFSQSGSREVHQPHRETALAAWIVATRKKPLLAERKEDVMRESQAPPAPHRWEGDDPSDKRRTRDAIAH